MLNAKQLKLIPLIIQLGNIDKACKEANIDRKTYYNWLENEEFAAELKKQQDSFYNDALVELNNLVGDAVATYRELLDSADESIKFRTASAILENRLKLIESKDLQERIKVIEESLEQQKGA